MLNVYRSLTAMSPSSQRAWIEIRQQQFLPQAVAVALLAEGVDRNIKHERKAC